jgi:hypothetical protein
MNNIAIREFQQSIVNFVNQSPLEIELKRIVVEGIATQLKVESDKQISMELHAKNKESKGE